MRSKSVLAAILVTAMFLGALSLRSGRAAESQIAFCQDNLIRLHVVANSDEPGDQELKLVVRDAVLQAVHTLLRDQNDAKDAYECLKNDQQSVRAAVHQALLKAGAPPDYALEIGTFAFPDREYDGLIVPAGDYRSIRVLLGKAEGQNWWCVLFPPLCFKELTERIDAPNIADKIAETQLVLDESSLKAPKTEYRSGLLDWLRGFGASKDASPPEAK